MNWIKSHKRTCCLLLAIILGMFFLVIPKCTNIPVQEYNKPDSLPKIIEIEKPFVKPEIKENVKPKVEKKYKKKDIGLRKEAEKKDIILDFKIVDGQLKEDIIDTLGQIREKDVPIPVEVTEGVKEINVGQDGKVNVEEKTRAGKILQKIGKGVKKGGKIVIVGLAAVGVITIVLLAGGN